MWAKSTTKKDWGPSRKTQYPGGSFVQSVVNNELRQSFNFADSVCRQALHFFVVMVSNVDMPVEIWKQKVLELEKGE